MRDFASTSFWNEAEPQSHCSAFDGKSSTQTARILRVTGAPCLSRDLPLQVGAAVSPLLKQREAERWLEVPRPAPPATQGSPSVFLAFSCQCSSLCHIPAPSPSIGASSW